MEAWGGPTDLFEKMEEKQQSEGFFMADANIEYFYNHSGGKKVSPLIKNILSRQESSQDVISDLMKAKIRNLIISAYWDKWTYIKDNILSVTYDPTTNYKITQTDTPNMTYTSVTSTKSKVVTEKDDSIDNDVFGFNSAVSVPSSNTESGGTETVTRNSDDNVEDETRTENGTRTMVREGNNGEQPYQALIMKELELRNIRFMEIVYSDVDKLLTLQIY